MIKVKLISKPDGKYIDSKVMSYELSAGEKIAEMVLNMNRTHRKAYISFSMGEIKWFWDIPSCEYVSECYVYERV